MARPMQLESCGQHLLRRGCEQGRFWVWRKMTSLVFDIFCVWYLLDIPVEH